MLELAYRGQAYSCGFTNDGAGVHELETRKYRYIGPRKILEETQICRDYRMGALN